MQIRTTAAALLITLGAIGAESAPADAQTALLSGYTMTSWTLADGMPLGPVYAIVQDADGYLWLGTASGLVRFDGARFMPWQAISASPFPHTDVQALAWSHSGTLWIGFGQNDGGTTVAALRNGVLTTPAAGAAPKSATTALVEDHRGRVWAVSNSALYQFRGGRWAHIHDPQLDRVEVVSVREDRRGAIWVGSRQGVFRARADDSFELVNDGVGRETSEGADGALWMTDPVHGARRPGARAAVTGIDGRGMRLLHDSRGNLWVATTGQGLWRIRDTSHARIPLVERATTQTGLSSDAVQSLLEDREGNIWVGTMLGLHSLTPQDLRPVASASLVRAILPDADGSVWLGTATGLVRYRRDGDTWRGRAAGTSCDIRSLFRDLRGTAWAETDRGLRAIVGGQLVERRSSIRRVTAVSPIDPQTVDAVFDDAEGTTWAGGSAGLWRIRHGETQRLGAPEGLPAIRVLAITASDDGYLWLAVDRGPLHAGRRAALVRLHPTDFDRAVHGATTLAGYRIFDATNGLAGVPIAPVTAARSTDGSLWFDFGGNVTVVDPKQVLDARSPIAAAARIAGVAIDDRIGDPALTPMLPAGTRKVQIEYTALRLTAARQIRFRYRLDGFDSDWIDAGARRQAYYTNLAPGDYVFRVQTSGDEGTWTMPEARWRFTVRPAFHQTTWFYALCGTALLLIGGGAAKIRVWILNRQFAAALAERARLSRELHDTMLQSLVGIALQVQAIARSYGPEASGQQSRLVALRRDVEEYIRDARHAIQNLRSPMLEACGLSGALRELGRRFVMPPTRFELTADTVVGVPGAVEGELLRIAQEAITNAAHHANASVIRVELRQRAGVLHLRVSDDGSGFDVDATLSTESGHYGLAGMRERAARVRGRVTITSASSGTVVEAIVPCVRRLA